jgi:hypothetical protein
MRNLYLHLVLQLRAFRVSVIAGVLSIACLAGGQNAAASVLHYTFTGKVSTALSAPFGLPVSTGALLSGDFSYDTSVLGVQGSTPSTMKYDQPFALNVTFGPGTPSAVAAAVNGYRIEVTDNSSQPGGAVVDLVSLLYTSAVLPASGFEVNGVPRTAGLLRINFFLPSSTLAAPILPPDFNSYLTQQPTSFFADTPTGSIDVFFSALVPEPGSNVLIALGAMILFAARKRIPSIKRKG